jgi:hypothetical protein
MDDPELIRLDTPTKDLWPPKNIDELDVEIEEVSDEEEEEPEEEEQVKFDTSIFFLNSDNFLIF